MFTTRYFTLRPLAFKVFLVFLIGILSVIPPCMEQVSAADIIVDNKSSLVTYTGDWPNSTLVPGYYSSNYQYNLAGTGLDKATWTVTLSSPGNYRVWAWWSSPYSTRPSNAPFRIVHFGGETTVRVDQRVNGGKWNELAVRYFEAGAAKIILSDDADGNVIADAIRFEYVGSVPPTLQAEFTATNAAGPVPLPVSFIDQSLGNVTNWNWNFGDNTSSTEKNPVHTYTYPGNYTVTLSIQGPDGKDTKVKADFITAIPYAYEFIPPIDTKYKTSIFQDFGNPREGIGLHTGEDWGVYEPDVPVLAVGDGVVEDSRDLDPGFGNMIVLKHLLPGGSHVYSLVSHMATPVQASFPYGKVVRKGEVLGTVGETGWTPSGLHIHLQFMQSPYALDGYANSLSSYRDPSDFIFSHRRFTPDVIIVDNEDPKFLTIGTWNFNDARSDTYSVSYLASGAGLGENSAAWTFTVHDSGIYNVYAWWTGWTGRATDAKYRISHAGGENISVVSQSANSGRWNYLGTFEFWPGEFSVALMNDATGSVSADAIKLVKTGALDVCSDGTVFGEPSVRKPKYCLVTDYLTDKSLTYGCNPGGVPQTDGTCSKSEPGIIMDNGDPGFSTTGVWNPSTTVMGFYGSNYLYTDAGSGGTATWAAVPKVAGTYEVFIWDRDKLSYIDPSDRATDAMYRIRHAFGTTSVTVNQKHIYKEWISLGAYYFDANVPATVTVGSSSIGAVIADAARFLFISTQLPPPKAEFSAAPLTGDLPLKVQFSDLSSGKITQYLWDFGDGTSNSLQNPSHTYATAGEFTVSLTVAGPSGSNTTTKTAYIWVTDPTIRPMVIDNEDPGFSVVGDWPNSTLVSGYYGTNYQYNLADAGNDRATWTFNIPVAGNFRVSAWWSSPFSTRPSNAPFTVQHAAGNTTVRVDQRVNGEKWNLLGTFPFNPGAAQVFLTDNADGNVIADAVMLEYVPK